MALPAFLTFIYVGIQCRNTGQRIVYFRTGEFMRFFHNSFIVQKTLFFGKRDFTSGFTFQSHKRFNKFYVYDYASWVLLLLDPFFIFVYYDMQ